MKKQPQHLVRGREERSGQGEEEKREKLCNVKKHNCPPRNRTVGTSAIPAD